MKREYNLNIIGKRKIFFIISSSLILIAILFSFIFGVGLDIQFSGGTMLNYSYTGTISDDDIQAVVKETLGKDCSIRHSTDILTGKDNMVISLNDKSGVSIEDQEKLTKALTEKFKDHAIESGEANSIAPTIGREFFAKCLVAVAFASLLLIVYIAFRFKKISGWSAGCMAVIALLHDVAMVYATFVIFRIPLNDNFIAVVLTILGYSINDTIVIYDRVRENKKLYGKSLGTAELMNKSLNQTLTRTINTSAATILAMIVVLIVSMICNIDSIFTFAFPIIIGMISGVYSSLCISSSLWVVWQEHKEKKNKNKSSKPVKAKA